jgi:hypothetical protein
MRSSRRSFLQASAALGAGLVTARVGFEPRVARAAGAPKKLLTIYVPGGWMPSYFFVPLSKKGIETLMPATPGEIPLIANQAPGGFTPGMVRSLATGAEIDPGPNAPSQPIRVPKMWDEASLAAGQPDAKKENPLSEQKGLPTRAHGWAWRHYKLWEQCVVVHGVDQQTAAHASGVISMMSGAAGPTYRSPALHSIVANHFYGATKEQRALPCVVVGDAPMPNPMSLPASSAPTQVGSIGSLANLLSDHSDYQWEGLRERSLRPAADYAGQPAGEIALTDLEAYALEAARRHRGSTTEGTDLLLQKLHDGLGSVSKLIARDTVTLLEKTKGLEHLLAAPPYWAAAPQQGPFVVEQFGYDIADQWKDSVDLALRFLKSNLSTSVALSCLGPGNFYFDTHGSSPGAHFVKLWPTMEVIGRILGEMKNSPGTSGTGSLLDETLVVIWSEFARTWPHAGDHWPTTSVVFAGGGVASDLMLGGYDEVNFGKGSSPTGNPVSLLDEGGAKISRPPTSGDVVFTALRALDIPASDFFIPGGPGEILGVRKS